MSANTSIPEYLLKTYTDGWTVPTNIEIINLKNASGLNSTELAKMADMDPKHFRMYCSERSYIQGRTIPYPTWRFWLEELGYAQPVKLQPKDNIVNESNMARLEQLFSVEPGQWVPPTLAEFRAIVARTGYSHVSISRMAGVTELVANNLLKGKASERDLSQPVTIFGHAKWMNFLKQLELPTVQDLLSFPPLPAVCLASIDDGFQPPNPRQLRRFIAWTGYTVDELSHMFDLKPSRLSFYMSNRSSRNSNLGGSGIGGIDPRVFSRDDWRPPYFHELRTLMNVKSLDPMSVARALKLSTQEMKVALLTRDNDKDKGDVLPIEQEVWYAYLDHLKIFNTEDLQKRVSSEGQSHHIHYTIWRLFLYAFGVLKPLVKARPAI